MLTTEQLLQKRFKFISPYPGGHWEIGEVFELCGNKCYATEGMSHLIMHESILMAYPAIFQPLPWWSEREVSEMPAYVKVIREDCIKDTGLYCKVYKWSPLGDKWPEMKGQVGAELEGYSPLYLSRNDLTTSGQVYGRLNATHLEPATLEQYNQQKEGKK